MKISELITYSLGVATALGLILSYCAFPIALVLGMLFKI